MHNNKEALCQGCDWHISGKQQSPRPSSRMKSQADDEEITLSPVVIIFRYFAAELNPPQPQGSRTCFPSTRSLHSRRRAKVCFIPRPPSWAHRDLVLLCSPWSGIILIPSLQQRQHTTNLIISIQSCLMTLAPCRRPRTLGYGINFRLVPHYVSTSASALSLSASLAY